MIEELCPIFHRRIVIFWKMIRVRMWIQRLYIHIVQGFSISLLIFFIDSDDFFSELHSQTNFESYSNCMISVWSCRFAINVEYHTLYVDWIGSMSKVWWIKFLLMQRNEKKINKFSRKMKRQNQNVVVGLSSKLFQSILLNEIIFCLWPKCRCDWTIEIKS